MASETRLPVYLWIEAAVAPAVFRGHRPVYVSTRGDKAGGLVLQKIADMAGRCRLLVQQRDMDGNLIWTNGMEEEFLAEKAADDYIARAVKRDPDLWVVEIEDKGMNHALHTDLLQE